MKSCNPRRWPELRFLLGVLIVALVAALLVLVTGSVIVGFAGALVVVGADSVAFRMRGRLKWRACRARLWIDDDDRELVVVAGSAVTLRGRVQWEGGGQVQMIAPLLPRSVRAVEPVGRVLRGQAPAGELSWTIEAVQAGNIVLPGVLLVDVSPLGLRRTVAMAPARTSLFAVFEPDAAAALINLVKRRTVAGEARRHFLRGGGTDFRELRQYVELDPLSRVDWKATARRSELIVRDMEEPRELTMSVVLDASSDMTHGIDGSGIWFERALQFLANLGDIASRSGIRLEITIYDDGLLHHIRLQPGGFSTERLFSELAALPRAAALRHLQRSAAQHGRLDRFADQRLRAWGVPHRDADAYLDRYFAGRADADTRHALLADTDAAAILNIGSRCPSCGERVFADEGRCAACGAMLTETGVPARAASASIAVAEAVGRSRGRQMLFFISSLCGGEMSHGVCEALIRACEPHRSVNVVAPSAQELLGARPGWPGSIGPGPVRRDMIRDIDRLTRAAEFTAFRRSLKTAGIDVHCIDDNIALHELMHAVTARELHVV